MPDNASASCHHPVVRRRLCWLAAAALPALGGAALAWWRSSGAPALAGGVPQVLWQHRLITPAGVPLALAQWRGQPLLVNFWATWCPPCVRELPLLDAFAARQAGHGIQVVALALDKGEAVQRFLARQPLRFPVALVPEGGMALIRALGNEQGGLPFSLLLARDGRIRKHHLGELDSADLAAWSRAVSRG